MTTLKENSYISMSNLTKSQNLNTKNFKNI